MQHQFIIGMIVAMVIQLLFGPYVLLATVFVVLVIVFLRFALEGPPRPEGK